MFVIVDLRKILSGNYYFLDSLSVIIGLFSGLFFIVWFVEFEILI